MKKQPIEILCEGRRVLDPVLCQHGFSFVDGPSGKSSAGPYASGAYVNGDRKLEIHYRHALGLVTYSLRREISRSRILYARSARKCRLKQIPGFFGRSAGRFTRSWLRPPELCDSISERTVQGVCALRIGGRRVEENAWIGETTLE